MSAPYLQNTTVTWLQFSDSGGRPEFLQAAVWLAHGAAAMLQGIGQKRLGAPHTSLRRQ